MTSTPDDQPEGQHTDQHGVPRIRATRRGPRARSVAIAASLLWGVVVLGYAYGFVASASESRGTVLIDTLFFLVVLGLPLILIWVTTFLVEELARLRFMLAALTEQMPPLIADLSATRATLASEGPISAADLRRAVEAALRDAPPSELNEPLGRLLSGQEELHADVRALFERVAPKYATAAAARPAPKPVRRPAGARATPPDPAPAAEPVDPDANRPDWPELVRALDFPRDADDAEGFRALRGALRHHGVAQCLQAAEDVLTLLSQVGIYMDDLDFGPEGGAALRRYIAGERSSAFAGTETALPAETLEAARGLVKADPIFRDTALHFQRRFDAVLVDFGRDVADDRLAVLGNTRSGRAFMLLSLLNGA